MAQEDYNGNQSLKFLIIGDLHGHMPRIREKNFDAIIATGDFCATEGITKVFRRLYKKYVKNESRDVAWWDVVGRKNARKITYNSLNAGKRILEYLDSIGKPVFLVPGNWDWTREAKETWGFMNEDFWNHYLKKGLKNIVDLDGKVVKYRGIVFVGYGRCNGPELLRYRHYTGVEKARYRLNESNYRKLLKKYNKLFLKAIRYDKPIILVNHNVPYKTKLDKIVSKGNPMDGKHYGSNLTRALIERHKPLISIGGHMHEHFGKDKIGKTVIVNAGYGSNSNTLLEISAGKIRLRFTR